MPLYDYLCETCGPFEAMTPMSRFAEPHACPDCAAESPRVMLTAPSFSTLATATRRAHETNERSADSPKRTSTHGPGCGCCGGGRKKNSGTLYRPDGSKTFPAKRPWMISH